MAYFLIILPYKFDSSITTEHAGIKKNNNEAPNFCCWFFWQRQVP